MPPLALPAAEACPSRPKGSSFRRARLAEGDAFGSGFAPSAVAPPAGSRFGVVFGLANDGGFAVEVVDVRLDVYEGYFADPRPFTSRATGGNSLPYAPLEPFDLAPGQARDVGVSYLLTGCADGPTEPSAGAVIFRTVAVTWRFAGITRTSDVPLSFSPELHGMPHCASTD